MAAQTTLLDVSSLKENPDNPRTITEAKFEALVRSIKEFPGMLNLRPLVATSDLVVLGGNMRLRAARAAGLTQVPVVMASDLTAEQQREFVIRDNVGFGEWEWDKIVADWPEAVGWGLDIPEFALPKAEAVEDDYEIPDEIQTDIVVGDLFEIGVHRLVCGDSTKADDVERLMNGQKADMVFTDPPYALFGNSTGVSNVVDDNMVRPFFKNIMKVCQNNVIQFGHIYMCCDWHSAFSIQICAREVNLKAKNMCIWDKGDGGVGAMYQQCYEIVWFFDNSPSSNKTMGKTKAGVRTVQGVPNIWRQSRVSKDRVHNAQKPVEIISIPITNGSEISDTVLDPFLGSGTTMVAAHQLNRKCYGIEIDPKYCQVIVDRMRKLDPAIEIKKNGVPLSNVKRTQS